MLSTTDDVRAALASDSFTFAWLLDLPSVGVGERLYLTDNATDITVGDTTYVSNGVLLGLPAIVRDGKIRSHSVTLTLSGNATSIHDTFVHRNMTGEDVTIRLALFGADGALVAGTPLVMFAGSFDSWSYREATSGDTISIKLTGPWFKPSSMAGRFTSDTNQKERYAGDRFFEYAHIQRDNIGWGKEG